MDHLDVVGFVVVGSCDGGCHSGRGFHPQVVAVTSSVLGQGSSGQVLAAQDVEEVYEPRNETTEFAPERGRHDTVEEKVQRGVDCEEEVRDGTDEEDGQWQTDAIMSPIFHDLIEVDDFVDSVDDPRDLANQKCNHDGDQHDGLSVLLGCVCYMSSVSVYSRTWKHSR